MNNPKDGADHRVLMSPEQILTMTEMSSSIHEEKKEEQQGKTRKKKSLKKKATKPDVVASKSVELSSKDNEDSDQQASSSKGKKAGEGRNDEPGVKNFIKKNVRSPEQILAMTEMSSSFHEENTEEQQGKTRNKKSLKKKKATKPGVVASKSVELSSKDYEDSDQQASSSKGKKAGEGGNDEPGFKNFIKKNVSKANDSIKSKAENNVDGEEAAVSRKLATPGAIIINGINATHQDGMDLEEGGSRIIDAVGAAEESEPLHVEAQDGTVTATAIARDDLEQEMRERLYAEAVEADVIKSSSPAHTNRKWMILGCILLLLIIVGVVVGVVVGTGDSGGGDGPGGGNGPGGDKHQALLDDLKEQSPDKGMALSDLASPQYKAFLWLTAKPADEQDGPPKRNLDLDLLRSRYTMATLYYSAGGENWTRSDNWLSPSHISTWWYPSSESGDFDANQNILKLDLRNNNLVGTLPNELVFLSSLQVIELGRNALTGRIPSEFARLVNLEKVMLRDNDLTGTVDSAICNTLKENQGRFAVDCGEVECTCCTPC
jgi:hypothetical protein